MPVGGQGSYPSLELIANLTRVLVNDDKAGATGTPGEGQILTDSSTTLQNLLNSAIRDTYRDVSISGQPTLIKDNYILPALPPVNSSLGVGVQNPAVQVAIQFAGYFDGLEMWPNLTLPADLIYPMQMWERQTGTSNLPFGPMRESTGALRSRLQVQWLGEWEWRTDGIWMPGATLPRDVRLRYISTYPDLAFPNVNFNTTYVPILDSQDAIADKISVVYARRLGGTALADAMMAAKASIFKLKQRITRDRQKIDYQRKPYGGGNTQSGGALSQWLF